MVYVCCIFSTDISISTPFEGLQQLSVHFSDESKHQVMEWPVMFRDNPGIFHGHSTTVSKVSYPEFLSALKSACSAVGLDSSLFGTHSLRRGSTTDQFLHGIPDKVIKYSGRWRSNAFERYIDQEQILQLVPVQKI